jgi:hypothetical protein
MQVGEQAATLDWEEPDAEQLALLPLWLRRDAKGLAIPSMRRVFSAIDVQGPLLNAAQKWRDRVRLQKRTTEIRKLVKSASLATEEADWFIFLGEAPFKEKEIGKSLSDKLREAGSAEEIGSLAEAIGLLRWTSRRVSASLVKAAVHHAKSPHENRVAAASRVLGFFPPERQLEGGTRKAARKAFLAALGRMTIRREIKTVVESLLRGGYEVPAKYQAGSFLRVFERAWKAVFG